MVSFNLFVVLCCLSTVAGLKFTHLTGRFGDQRIPLDITFGQDTMEVSTYKPENAQASFRPTANLHIFKTKIVAIRNWMDKICYIQHFNATEDQMKERVQNAIQISKVTPELSGISGTHLAMATGAHRLISFGTVDQETQSEISSVFVEVVE